MKLSIGARLAVVMIFSCKILFGQVDDVIAGEDQVFYSLEYGEVGRLALSDWDIAIDPQGDYTIRINEYSGARVWVKSDDRRENCSAIMTSCRGLQDYQPSGYDTLGMSAGDNNWIELHNGYTSWKDGALNQFKETLSTDLVSYGWGGYKGFSSDPLHAIIGYRIFIVKTQKGSYYQFFVRKSISTGYDFAFAKLDGSELKEHTIKRGDYANKQFCYLSLDQNRIVSTTTTIDKWDFILTKYPEQKAIGTYQVKSGILLNPYKQTETVQDVNACAQANANYSTDINAIGQTWHNNDVVCGCVKADHQLSYFISDSSNSITKLKILNYNEALNGYALSMQNLNGTTITAQGVVKPVSCNTCDDASIKLAISGGACPYTITWSHGAQGDVVEDLAPGTYHVVIKDANLQEVQLSFTVEPFPCTLAFGQSSKKDISCFGKEDGSLLVEFIGEIGAVEVFWNGNLGSNSLSQLGKGSYNVEIIDEAKCSITKRFSVEEPQLLTVDENLVHESCYQCQNASIDLIPLGGLAPYTVVWGDGATSMQRENLQAGAYSYQVLDKNSCAADGELLVEQYLCDSLTVLANLRHQSCFGINDAQVVVDSVIGAVGNVEYSWSNGQKGRRLLNLEPGNYSVTIEDSKGCVWTKDYELLMAEEITADAMVGQINCATCADGNIKIGTISGGQGPYKLLWNTGDTTDEILGLAPGNYSLLITDAKACEKNFTYKILEPGCELEILQFDAIEPSCFGFSNGELSVDYTGAKGEVSFNWSSGSTLQFANGLESGSYSLTISDTLGCTDSAEVFLKEPPALHHRFDFTEASCTGCTDAQLKVVVTGGVKPYVYQWSTGESYASIPANSGFYEVLVKDANLCRMEADTSLDLSTSVLESENLGELTLYPNPSKGRFFISKVGRNVGDIQIFDIQGRSVPFDLQYNLDGALVNLEAPVAGVYVLKCEDKSKTANFLRFVVE